jgi:hypothetical protein
MLKRQLKQGDEAGLRKKSCMQESFSLPNLYPGLNGSLSGAAMIKGSVCNI